MLTTFVVIFVSGILSVVLLVAFPNSLGPSDSSGNADAARFFDMGTPVLVLISIGILLCLMLQIVKKANWRKAFGMDSFPDRRAWLRAFPVGLLFVAVFAGSLYGFFSMQLHFIQNFDPNAMFERLESSRPQQAIPPTLSGMRNASSFPDMKEFEERMLYIYKYPFENGFLSKRFLLYFSLLLLYALIIEVVFRGIGFAGYMRTGSGLRALIITSIVSGIFFFPVGLVWASLLGWVRMRSGSLYCSIAASMLGVVAMIVILYFGFARPLL